MFFDYQNTPKQKLIDCHVPMVAEIPQIFQNHGNVFNLKSKFMSTPAENSSTRAIHYNNGFQLFKNKRYNFLSEAQMVKRCRCGNLESQEGFSVDCVFFEQRIPRRTPTLMMKRGLQRILCRLIDFFSQRRIGVIQIRLKLFEFSFASFQQNRNKQRKCFPRPVGAF